MSTITDVSCEPLHVMHAKCIIINLSSRLAQITHTTQQTTNNNTDVKIIYDSVVSTLSERHDRKFIVVEVSFFSRWFNDQDDVMRKRVHWLVESGTSHPFEPAERERGAGGSFL